MHASAFGHMKLCVDTYLKKDRHYRVIDLGSQSFVGNQMTHGALMADYDCSITGIDITDGHNVDVVMTKPYRIPAKSNSADVIFSGQAFEHIPFFWVSFLEMCRVAAPKGLIFITAPSRGHVHYTMDSWRFYPDSMRSLAAFSRMKLVETYTDFPPRWRDTDNLDYAAAPPHAYWGDTVGVFRKPTKYSKLVAIERELSVWWANRVGGIEHIPTPRVAKGRRGVVSSI